MAHDHAVGAIKKVVLYDSGLGGRYRIRFNCGCFGAWTLEGKSLTGGDDMVDFDTEVLAAKLVEGELTP